MCGHNLRQRWDRAARALMLGWAAALERDFAA